MLGGFSSQKSLLRLFFVKISKQVKMVVKNYKNVGFLKGLFLCFLQILKKMRVRQL